MSHESGFESDSGFSPKVRIKVRVGVNFRVRVRITMFFFSG